MRKTILGLALAGLVAAPLAAQHETADLAAIYKIKAEGLGNSSQVMDIMSWLTDVYGPRLTNSPNIRKATEWTMKTFNEWGLANAHLEPFRFGRGWSNERTIVHVIAPQHYPVIAYAKAWTPGTKGAVTGEAMMVTIDSADDFAAYKGKLKGKFLLTMPEQPIDALWDAPAHRYTAEELQELSAQPEPRGGGPGRGGRGGFIGSAPGFTEQLNAFLVAEGVAATLEPGRGNGGTVFVSAGRGASREPDGPPTVPQLVLATEHYNRIVRTLDRKVPVTLQVDVANTFHDENLNADNIIAELPGTDKKDEVVMLGGHFDSWQGGTGATDNAAGAAVMMEAIRILKATGLPLRRTVRIALWPGEEQGLLGSRAYVTEHFADRATMDLKPEHEKFAGYFNVDNGTGAIRGIYLQENEAVRPIFEAWMKPFNDMGMDTIAIRNTGGTDHQSFDAVGLPGFQFIQDPVEYGSRTHHSSMDVYERVQRADMMKNAVIVAAFVYHTANRDEVLPRKPLPQPQPAGRGRGGNLQ
jgi:hypothetical protein